MEAARQLQLPTKGDFKRTIQGWKGVWWIGRKYGALGSKGSGGLGTSAWPDGLERGPAPEGRGEPGGSFGRGVTWRAKSVMRRVSWGAEHWRPEDHGEPVLGLRQREQAEGGCPGGPAR